MRIVIASDSPMSPRTPEALANWDAVLRYVAATRPDLVLHLGDLSLDGASGPGDLRAARAQLDRLAVPHHALPGNHDVGDNPSPGESHGVIDEERLGRWNDIIGLDHFFVRIAGWTLVGINAQLVDSGLAAGAAQWGWLGGRVASVAGSGDRLALFPHKPVTAVPDELATAPPYRFVPASARPRLIDELRPALVGSGHVHQHRTLPLDGV